MTIVTITNLREHLGYYLKLSQKECIYITKYGKVIAVLTKPNIQKLDKQKKQL